MKVKQLDDKPVETDHYVVIEFPKINVASPHDAVKLLEQVRAAGYRPLHRLEGAFGNCFVCEKPPETQRRAS